MQLLSQGFVMTQEAGGKHLAVWEVIRYKGVNLRAMLLKIAVSLTVSNIAYSQDRLQISFGGKATLSVWDDLPSCGVFAGCPYEQDYCSDFWNLCAGQRTQTVVVPGSYLTLGGEAGGLGYSGGASLSADLRFLFVYRAPSLRVGGYNYTPKKDLGFLYFVDGVRAAALAVAVASCGLELPFGCCASASASAEASASVKSAIATASVSSSMRVSCSCENTEFCSDCTPDGRGPLLCDPNPCGSVRRAFQGHKVVFEEANLRKEHIEQLEGGFALSGSASACGAGSVSVAFMQVHAGIVVQNAPHPLGVPTIGENEYVWSAGSPAVLTIPASALGYTWGWEPDLGWIAERAGFSVKPSIESEDTKPSYQVVARGRELVAQSLDGRDDSLSDGLVYRRKYLPPHNSDFGLKRVYFEVDGTVDYAEVEVFYHANGTNHPPDGGAKGFETNGCEPIREITVPNWFYYYWEAYGSRPDVYYADDLYAAFGFRGLTCADYEGDRGCQVSNVRIYIYENVSPCREEYTIPLFRLVERHLEDGSCSQAPRSLYITRVDEELYVYGIHRYIATLEHESAHKRHLLNGILCDVSRYAPSRIDNDGDGLDDRWEVQHGLHSCSRFSADRRYPDAEVIAYIEGYGKLLAARDYWKQDWSDCGLQKGVPGPHFPWKYKRGDREANTPFYSDLLTEIPNTGR